MKQTMPLSSIFVSRLFNTPLFYAFLFCTLLLTFGFQQQIFSQQETTPKHLIDLRTLLEETLPNHTNYVHGEPKVFWKGEKGHHYSESYTDCSGLIDALLSYSYQVTKDDFYKWGHKKRPKARDYYKMIVSQAHFSTIHNIKHVAPGDIFAVIFPKGAGDKGHDTGHVAIIDSKPVMLNKAENMIEWDLPVIDSSGGHGTKDSRYLGNGKHRKGLGKGSMKLYTNFEGDFLGYAWTLSDQSTFQSIQRRPFAIGRFNP